MPRKRYGPDKTFECSWCLKKKKIKEFEYVSRIKSSKYGKIFCSVSCGIKHDHQEKGHSLKNK
jgi:hypothetical protein